MDHSKLWHFRQQPARFSNNQSKRFWSSSHHGSQTAGPASAVLHSICASVCIHVRETTSSSVNASFLLPPTRISEFLRCPFYNLSARYVTDSFVYSFACLNLRNLDALLHKGIVRIAGHFVCDCLCICCFCFAKPLCDLIPRSFVEVFGAILSCNTVNKNVA